MTASPNESLQSLFEQALLQPAGQRDIWIEANCDDPRRRLLLSAMVQADAMTAEILATPAHETADLLTASEQAFDVDKLVGKSVGAFRVERLIGQGGMASVFLAHREGADFPQQVALKVLQRGLYSAVEQRLFRRERRALAALEHANIARLIDGGVTAAGVPFLAMEFVDGEAITIYCAQKQLGLSARLRLFLTVCRAVDAAHRALIVHRDIKPSNILVTHDGTVKLLDFGIAKLLDQEGDETTHAGLSAMTPQYAAPEQIAGAAITTATDVYALGILLHELLLGERPDRDLPKRPSSRVTELDTDLWVLPAARTTLRGKLRGDLDNIMLKALEAEPQRRYASAGALADDLARHLDGQPVVAHPPSAWYRTRKFVQRHRGGVALTSVLVIAILASLALALWQGKVARAQAQRAEAARDFLLSVFEAAREDLPADARPTPDVLALAAADGLKENQSLAPDQHAEFLGSLALISLNSGNYAQALEQADAALAMLDANGSADSRVHVNIEATRGSALLRLERVEEAERDLEQRVEVFRRKIDGAGVDALAALAQAKLRNGHGDEGIAFADEAALCAEKVYGPDTREALMYRGAVGYAQVSAGQTVAAAATIESILAQWDAQGIRRDRMYANLLATLGVVKYRLGDAPAAVKLLRETLALRRTVHASPHEKIAESLQNLGTFLAMQGEFDEAASLIDESSTMYMTLFGPTHPQSISALNSLAGMERKRLNFAPALVPLQRAVALCADKALDNQPVCMTSWAYLVDVALRLGDVATAADAADRGLAARLKFYGAEHPEYAIGLGRLGDVRNAQTNPAAALIALDEGIRIFAARGEGNSLNAGSLYGSRALSLHLLTRDADALIDADKAMANTMAMAPKDEARRLYLLALRAEILVGLGRRDEARGVAVEATTLSSKRAVLEAGQWQRIEQIAHGN